MKMRKLPYINWKKAPKGTTHAYIGQDTEYWWPNYDGTPPHDWWRVEVKLYDGTLLAIEPELLAGKSNLTERDLETIRAAGRHLLGFAGT